MSKQIQSHSRLALALVATSLLFTGCLGKTESRIVADQAGESEKGETPQSVDVGPEIMYEVMSTNPDGSRVVTIQYVIEVPVTQTRSTIAADGSEVTKDFREMVKEYRTREILVPANEDISSYLRGRQKEIIGDFEFVTVDDKPEETSQGVVMDPAPQRVTARRPTSADPRLSRASFLNYVGKSRESLAVCEQLLSENPEDANAIVQKAHVLSSLNRYADSMKNYDAVLFMYPDDVQVLNGSAWTLATCPDNSVRDGRRAVELAVKACQATNFQEGNCLAILAACYAEAGDFEQAIQTSKKSIELIQDEESKQIFKLRLADLLKRKPVRQTSPEFPSQLAAIETMKKIDVLKEGVLNFNRATPEAKGWWGTIETNFQYNLPELLDFSQQASARGATIDVIFLAAVKSQAQTLDGILQSLDAGKTANRRK